MKTLHTVAELRAQIAAWRAAGNRIAFAPTMGNLHRGHLRLMESGRQRADRVVASVFVNPLQFGPNEDFDRYPRTLPDDQAALSGAGVDVLFAPSVAELYPKGRDGLTMVRAADVSAGLEGEFRPGHFDGVATVVNILLNVVRPDVALFGEKDYQQLAVIRRMVEDLWLPVEIVGVPTERDADGLALSSRNQYLDAGERVRAGEIHRCLSAMARALRGGDRDFESLSSLYAKRLKEKGFEVQYLVVRQPDLQPPKLDSDQFVVLVAARLGKTRLIDNLQVDMTEI